MKLYLEWVITSKNQKRNQSNSHPLHLLTSTTNSSNIYNPNAATTTITIAGNTTPPHYHPILTSPPLVSTLHLIALLPKSRPQELLVLSEPCLVRVTFGPFTRAPLPIYSRHLLPQPVSTNRCHPPASAGDEPFLLAASGG